MAFKNIVPFEQKEIAALIAVTVAFLVLLMSGKSWPWRDTLTPDVVAVYKPKITHEDSITSHTLTAMQSSGDAWIAESKAAALTASFSYAQPASATVRLTGDMDAKWTATMVYRSESAISRKVQFGIRAGETANLEIPDVPDDYDQGEWTEDRFEVSLSPTEAGAKLRRAEIVLSGRLPGERPDPFPAYLFGALLPAAMAIWLHFSGKRAIKRTLAIGTISGIVFWLLTMAEPRAADILLAVTSGMLMGAGGAAAFRAWREKTSDYRLAEILSIMGIVGLALMARWEAFTHVYTRRLLDDAWGYFNLASSGWSSFYNTFLHHEPMPDAREPLFPGLVHLWFWIAPETRMSMRVFGVLLGTLPPAVAWLLFRKSIGRVVALAVAIGLAVNPLISKYSAEGLRDDLLSALFLALLAAVVYTREYRWWRAVAFGVLAAALTLTRLNFLFFCPLVLVVVAWREKWRIWEALIALAMLAAAVTPHLVENYRQRGDAFYSANIHTNYYYNYAHIGEPGFPANTAEWARDPYVGDHRASTALLNGNPIATVARGYWRLFVVYPHGYLFYGFETLMIFGFAGLYAQRKNKVFLAVIAAFVVASFPLAVVWGIKDEPRLATFVAPAVYAVWAAGVTFVARALITRVSLARARRSGFSLAASGSGSDAAKSH